MEELIYLGHTTLDGAASRGLNIENYELYHAFKSVVTNKTDNFADVECMIDD